MERRRLQRTKIHHPGKVLNKKETVHECVVHNITGLGVCIEVCFETEQLPEELAFSFDNFRTIHTCKTIWRESNLAGIAFENLPNAPKLSDGSRGAKLKLAAPQ